MITTLSGEEKKFSASPGFFRVSIQADTHYIYIFSARVIDSIKQWKRKREVIYFCCAIRAKRPRKKSFLSLSFSFSRQPFLLTPRYLQYSTTQARRQRPLWPSKEKEREIKYGHREFSLAAKTTLGNGFSVFRTPDRVFKRWKWFTFVTKER